MGAREDEYYRQGHRRVGALPHHTFQKGENGGGGSFS